MKLPERNFEYGDIERGALPLLVACVGPQKSGKTYSAYRLALGMQRVIGGDVCMIDTEGGRGRHYADYFKTKYIAFDPPHGPLDYLVAIRTALKRGARTLIIDSASHEHEGEGGLLDQSEDFLEKKCGDDEGCRHRNLATSLIVPKRQRSILNREIVQLGLSAIFCFRAQEKTKWQKGKDPVALGWQPITTSPIFYLMTVSFLLPPFSQGIPTWTPETKAEALFLALPRQFQDWFKPGQQLTEEVGERMARWAAGDSKEPAPDLLAQIGGLLSGLPSQEAKKAALPAAFGVATWRAVQALPREKLEHGLALLQRARQESDDQAEAQRQAAAGNEAEAGQPRGTSAQEPSPGAQGSLLP